MRLREWEIEAIKRSVHEVYGGEAKVRLFGSRVHDHRRGGDIDLYVEPGRLFAEQRSRTRLSRLLQERLGERAIDIVYAAPENGSIDDVAKAEGVML